MSNMKLKQAKDLKQRDLEAWEETYQEMSKGVIGRSRISGATVRSAIKAGWFMNGASVDDVDDATPAEIRRLSDEIDALYTEVTTYPKV